MRSQRNLLGLTGDDRHTDSIHRVGPHSRRRLDTNHVDVEPSSQSSRPLAGAGPEIEDPINGIRQLGRNRGSQRLDLPLVEMTAGVVAPRHLVVVDSCHQAILPYDTDRPPRHLNATVLPPPRIRFRPMARPEQYPTHREPDRAPPLPFRAGEVSNGEFIPRAPTPARSRHRTHHPRAGGAHRTATRRRSPAVPPDKRRHGADAVGREPGLLFRWQLAGRRAARPTARRRAERSRCPIPRTRPRATTRSPATSSSSTCTPITSYPTVPGAKRPRRIESMIRDVIPYDCAAADPFECLDRESYVPRPLSRQRHDGQHPVRRPELGPEDAPVPFEANLATTSSPKASPATDSLVPSSRA